MNRIFLFSLILCLYGCISSISPEGAITNEKQLIDSLVFDTNFELRESFSGSFMKENRTHYFFSNPLTSKSILFFDDQGKATSQVQLDSVYKSLGKYPAFESIVEIAVISEDSIILLSGSKRRLILINEQGAITKSIDLVALMNLDESKFLLFSNNSSTVGNIDANNNFYAHVQVNIRKKQSQEKQEFWKESVINQWDSDYIFQASQLFSDSPTCRTGFKMVKYLFPKDSTKAFIPFNNFLVLDSTMLVSSIHSNIISVLEKERLKPIKKISIESQYTPIRKELIELDSMPMVNEIIQKEGVISGLYYNKYLEHYYASLSQKTSQNIYKEKGYTPWILQVYDSDFQLVKEIPFLNGDYQSFLFSTKNGFLVKYRSSSNQIFHEFSY